jgi:hypothetical protein
MLGSCIIHILNTGVVKFKRKFWRQRVNIHYKWIYHTGIMLLSYTPLASKCLKHDTIVFQLVMSIRYLTPILENLPQSQTLSYKNMIQKLL